MANIAFLDTNVLLRHLRQDHPEYSPRATALLERVEHKELKVHISDTVMFETVYTLHGLYKQPKAAIRDALLPLLDLPAIILTHKRRWHQVFGYYIELNISFADAYHAVLMEEMKLTSILSFDRDFDRVQGIQRLEP
ncbi:MAG: PIN domain-containing protein [Herpetosiphon sp.]